MKSLVPLLLASACSLGFMGTANAAFETSPEVTVTHFFAFLEYGGGDSTYPHRPPAVPPDSGCDRPILDSSRSTPRVVAHDDSIWSGSTGTYCRVYYINPV